MRRALPVLPLLLLSSCASLPHTAQTVTAPPADTDGVLGLIGRWGIAHACPVGPEMVYTAAHVLDPAPFIRDFPLVGYTFSDRRGVEGILIPSSVDLYRDVARARPLVPLSRWYSIAEKPPAPGEKLYLTGWDWGSVDSAFDEPSLEVTVARLTAGHIVLRESVEPGTSGGCLLNAKSEVVGLISFGKSVGKPTESRAVGVAVALYGPWLRKELEDEAR